MKREEILNGNKLIAEFMGIKYDENKYSHESSEFYFEDSELEYHFSWDWLMPVVEKIEKLDNGIYQVDILQEGCKIMVRCKNFNSPIDKTVSKMPEGIRKIESVYLAVIEFIKWYNENKI
jgi:hypothetical protein